MLFQPAGFSVPVPSGSIGRGDVDGVKAAAQGFIDPPLPSDSVTSEVLVEGVFISNEMFSSGEDGGVGARMIAPEGRFLDPLIRRDD